MAFFGVTHSTIGKSTHSPGFLFKHANYMARPSADPVIHTLDGEITRERFLSEASAYQHWAYGTNDNGKSNLRANARITNTFIVGFFHTLTYEQNCEAMLATARALSGDGKSRIWWSVHRDNPHNIHVHVLFPDRDENGKAVAMLAASPRDRAKAGFEHANATEYVRALWEREVNVIAEREGLEWRADRRGRDRILEEYIEQQRSLDAPERAQGDAANAQEPVQGDTHEVPELLQSEPDETLPAVQSDHTAAPDSPAVPDTPVEPTPMEADQEPIPPEEPDMAYVDPTAKIKIAATFLEQRDFLARAQQRMNVLETNMAQARADIAELRAHAIELRTEAVQWENAVHRTAEKLKAHTKANGKLKGFGVSLNVFGKSIGWQSAARQEAEHAKHAAEAVYSEWETVKRRSREVDASLQACEAQLVHTDQDYRSQKAAHEHDLSVYGNDLGRAVNLLQENAARHLEGVDPVAIHAEYETGTITPEEAIAACELIGAPEMARIIEEKEQGIEY